MHDCKMKRVTIAILVLCLGCYCCNGQEDKCISNFAKLENALLSNPENQYQIARAYFPLKREINPVCVTSYYYIGMNRSDVTKQDLENCHMYVNRGEVFTGCSKWKWCINSFYVKLNLAQLQDFSLYILFDETSELELPPMCYINDYEIHEHLLRLTVSLYHYARNYGQLGKGREFIGYAARFLCTYDIEKLYLAPKPSSINALSENENNSIDLYVFNTTILFISLLAFPMFATSFASFAYLLITEQLNGNEESADSPPAISAGIKKKGTSNLRFMLCSLVIICCIANGMMAFFQVSALQRKYEWFYLYPYVWLLIFIILKFFTSMKAVYMIENRLLSLPFWVEGTLLWILTMTLQLASWHLVFVLYGLVLNPLRALLYVLVMTVSLICGVVGLAVIMKFTVVLIFQYKQRFADINNTWLRRPNSLKKNRDKFPFIDVVLMFSLTMILVYVFTFGVFILQTDISSNSLSLDELTKLIIPKIFLIAIAWFSTLLFLTPEKIWKFKTDA